VSPAIVYDDYYITYCDENRAEVITEAQGVSDDPERFFLTLVKSDEYGWRLDNMEYKDCYIREATLMYNAVTLKREKFNAILGGGTQPENPRTTVVDGVGYTETDTGMSLVEMQKFFEESFYEEVIKYESIWNGTAPGIMLRDEYMRKYINEVYAEIDGVLYRRNGVPKWYLPELKIDVMKYYNEQSFIDNGEEIPAEVSIMWNTEWNNGVEEYTEVKIASELPITEVTE
ncbi:MAG: hypothetical protein IKK42_08950, partial [Oscillospiraceae bacterium]|nr:hypothetical protein [Oscillospiraceae bacterium]